MINSIELKIILLISVGILFIFYTQEFSSINTIEEDLPKHQQNNDTNIKHQLHDKRRYFISLAIAIPKTVENYTNVHQSWSYVFHSVITSLAWKNIAGYDAVIIVVLDTATISRSSLKLLKMLLCKIAELGGHVVFLDVTDKLVLRATQVIRMYTARMVSSFYMKDTDYLMMGDSDLWPLNKTYFIPPGDDIVFVTYPGRKYDVWSKWKNKKIPFYRMCHIGINVNTWKVVFPFEFAPMNVTYNENTVLKTYLPNFKTNGPQRTYFHFDEFKYLFQNLASKWGPAVYKPTWHAGPLWYLDQLHLSVQIHTFQQTYGQDLVYENRKKEKGCGLLEIGIKWEPDLEKVKNECRIYTHVIKGEIWGDVQWNRFIRLLNIYFTTEQLAYAIAYRNEFKLLYETEVVSGIEV